jgi:hypothetical protein
MSIFHYIGANKKLPLGERGSKKIDRGCGVDSKKVAISINSSNTPEGIIPLEQIVNIPDINFNEIEEYETMEDAAGIYIQDIHPIYAEIKKHFKSMYIYEISANFGRFQVNERLKELNEEGFTINKKCLIELFKFIEENINENEEIEIYTCWADEEEEGPNRKLDMTINLNSFEIGDNFELKDKQYIVVNRVN